MTTALQLPMTAPPVSGSTSAVRRPGPALRSNEFDAVLDRATAEASRSRRPASPRDNDEARSAPPDRATRPETPARGDRVDDRGRPAQPGRHQGGADERPATARRSTNDRTGDRAGDRTEVGAGDDEGNATAAAEDVASGDDATANEGPTSGSAPPADDDGTDVGAATNPVVPIDNPLVDLGGSPASDAAPPTVIAADDASTGPVDPDLTPPSEGGSDDGPVMAEPGSPAGDVADGAVLGDTDGVPATADRATTASITTTVAVSEHRPILDDDGTTAAGTDDAPADDALAVAAAAGTTERAETASGVADGPRRGPSRHADRAVVHGVDDSASPVTVVDDWSRAEAATSPQPERPNAGVSGLASAPTRAQADPPGAPDPLWRQVHRALGALRTTAEGQQEITLRLHPAELGSVMIRISTGGAGTMVAMVTETGAAANQLNQQRQQLLDELASTGLDGASVDIGTRDGSGHPGDDPRGRPGRNGAGTVASGLDADHSLAADAGPIRRRSTNTVDLTL
ncbi:MAG: flagellar hook-length control protein FliK [Acidimicrobiales bacterium]